MNKKRVLAMLLAGTMCASLAGCGGSNGSLNAGSTAANGKYNVSVILKTLSAEYWQYVKSGAEAYAKENPDVVSVDVKGPSSKPRSTKCRT